MPRQIRHGEPQDPTTDPVETTLGEVRRANLNGRLYPHPPSHCKRKALRVLRSQGIAERWPRTRMSLGGWFAAPYGSAKLRA